GSERIGPGRLREPAERERGEGRKDQGRYWSTSDHSTRLVAAAGRILRVPGTSDFPANPRMFSLRLATTRGNSYRLTGGRPPREEDRMQAATTALTISTRRLLVVLAAAIALALVPGASPANTP